mmetsp:Transcript_9122/g.34098  ORF Transcript_9122/g.34098 Transcript_9122/m.34098 type:complete len:202 (-) Transcript_9122:1680-2285(-)
MARIKFSTAVRSAANALAFSESTAAYAGVSSISLPREISSARRVAVPSKPSVGHSAPKTSFGNCASGAGALGGAGGAANGLVWNRDAPGSVNGGDDGGEGENDRLERSFPAPLRPLTPVVPGLGTWETPCTGRSVPDFPFFAFWVWSPGLFAAVSGFATAGVGDAARTTSAASISAFKSTLGGGVFTAHPDQEGPACADET